VLSRISLERKSQTANKFGKGGNANRFTRTDIWNFAMMAMAPFWMFYCAYFVQTEKAALICIILGVLYSLYWVFVLFFGLDRACFWKEWN
jgi:hypothetical protein